MLTFEIELPGWSGGQTNKHMQFVIMVTEYEIFRQESEKVKFSQWLTRKHAWETDV
jgi:hypothetical protein